MRGNKLSKDITYEDCLEFKNEHPDMKRLDIIGKFNSYYRAMKRLNLYDELYPSRRYQPKYTDEELIAEAKKYQTRKELKEKNYKIHKAISNRKLEGLAYAHMKNLDNRKNRMIYVYEFPDHSAYIGLTYNYERRGESHLKDERSAVNKHIKKTRLTPLRKKLTDYVPVREAQQLEEYYVEQYKADGWNILNVVKTGGTGMVFNSAEEHKIIELHNQGLTYAQIAEQLHINKSTVYHYLKDANLTKKGQGCLSVMVEEVDTDGNIIHTYNSCKELAELLGVHAQTIRGAMKAGYNVRGHLFRYNAEDYRNKLKKELPDVKPRKRKSIPNLSDSLY